MIDVKCDLCGRDDYLVIWDKGAREAAGVLRGTVARDEDGRIQNGRSVICLNCGLVYVTPRMSDEELDEFYRTQYRELYPINPEIEDIHATNAMSVIRQLPAGIKRMLDVGCSTGKLVDRLSKALDAWGLEPNAEIKHPRIISERLENYEPDKPFDLVTMLNTLEHLPSPVEALRHLRRLMAPEGHLLISVPNLETRMINITTDAFMSCAHLYQFTLPVLVACLMKVGLKPTQYWVLDERIGEKLYVLSEAGEPQEPKYQPPDVLALVNHLQMMDKVIELKVLMGSWGYR